MVNLERTRGLEPAFGVGLSPETGPDNAWFKHILGAALSEFWAQVLMESMMSQPKSPHGPTAIEGAVTHVPSSLLL